jgi:hypothetical protein
MIRLTFEPAFDPFHTIFRLLRLRTIIAKTGPLPRDHVRILDFFLLFPFRIASIRLAPHHRRYRKLASKYEAAKPYGEQPDDRLLFNRMEPIQVAALDTLSSHNLTDSDQWKLGEVRATAVLIPNPIAARVEQTNAADAELIEFLGVLASEYELSGVNGLKGRTGLLEYRYDAI